MSTDMSVPRPRAPGLDVCDSALLDTLLREAPIGFAFFGADLRFRRVNAALAQLAGIEPAGHIGRTPAEVWPAALAAGAQAALSSVLADGRPLESEPGDDARVSPQAPAGHVHADGLPADHAGAGGSAAGRPAAQHWRFSWYPSHDPDGDLAGVALIAVDHAQRRGAAETLRRSQERYRSLVQAGAQVVWVTTPAGEIAEDSPEWRWITGQGVEEYLAAGWLAVIHPDDRERIGQDWQDSLRSGKAFDSRYRVRTKTGSYRHYDVRAVAVERDGKIIEWVGASTDVTGQREAEEMRGSLTEQL